MKYVKKFKLKIHLEVFYDWAVQASVLATDNNTLNKEKKRKEKKRKENLFGSHVF